MIVRAFGLAAATIVALVGGASIASAQQVERNGNGYNVIACARGVGQGEARCYARIKSDARGNLFVGKNAITPNAVPSGYGPADLRSAYNSPSSGGNGRVVAIVDAYGYSNAESDLAVYRAQYGLPACTTANGCFKKVNQSGGTSYPRNNTGWDQEQALDLDMVSAMCPDCKILLVQTSSTSLANLGAGANEAAALGASVISNSYGGGESGTSSYASAYNHPGVAVTVSSGDSGYGAQFPATANTVIAVGGTSLTRASNTRGWSETAWNSGGSGCSTVYAKPSYETDSLCTMRMEADISAVGDPNTGVAVYGPGSTGKSQWMVFGGTSVASPLIGGMYGVTGKTANGASTIFADSASGFNDVTSGSNGSCGGTYFCTAGAGYDGPTGRGTPIGVAGL
ncbi:S53 family peptidase [Sphingomonas sp. ASV193]|uniref:S53 family peptidase n=1 Tax=Sphingomonas sp. ASV193 TaxID=3144405 RepID=UPI0032E8BA88